MNIPKHWCYYDYANSNYGLHALAFRDSQGNVFYFSYDTLVAFSSIRLQKKYCLKNYWQATTGKHLNKIEPNHKMRLEQEAFDAMYKLAFAEEGVKVYENAN